MRTLILTHEHADHAGGARAFAAAGARVVCQEADAAEILALVSKAATRPDDPMSGKASLKPVVESVAERVMLLDGIEQVEILFLGSAHTRGDLVVYLPTDKVLYAGDLAANGHMPYLQSADVDPVGWERALTLLAQVPAEKVVPGHGDVGTKQMLTESLAYVHEVNKLARKLIDAGVPDTGLDAQIRAPENAIRGNHDERRARRQHQGRRESDQGEGGEGSGADPGSEVTRSGGITLCSGSGARADVALAIPPVNVLTADHLGELADAVRAAAPARLLVLTGLPRAFCAGVDVADHVPEPPGSTGCSPRCAAFWKR